jgi:UDP-4-amino-4,6-dideoxy-N-acetyl-beta-L-altrosamine transaminase
VSAAPLPYGRQEITETDIAAVSEALRRPLITQGPTVDEFEAAFADAVGARNAVAFSSGTAALHGAAHAAGLNPGDEVLCPPVTFVASANCALFVGARPRFVDIDAATWNLDAAAAAAAAGPNTKAVVAVSLAGLPVDLEPLVDVRDRVCVIEDGCHALGAHRSGRRVGGPGGADMTVFSLHPVKTITTGEGGVVTTESDEFARRLRSFRTHGVERVDVAPEPWEGSWYYEVQELGFNYRLTDFQAALGLSQLTRLEDWVTRRNQIADAYRSRLAGEPRIALPPAAPPGSRHGYHLFVIQVLSGRTVRQAVFEGLRAQGIGVQVHYIPIYRFPFYRHVLGFAQDECPEAERYYAGAISLPMFPGMTDGDVDRVVRALTEQLDQAEDA